jgi:hypothetical protein
MSSDDVGVSRILGIRGKLVNIEIRIQYPSDPGYLLIASLGKKNESIMRYIVKTIAPYGFNSLLVNFQIHKSVKIAKNPSELQAKELLEKICYDLIDTKDEKKSGLFGFLKKDKKTVQHKDETAKENVDTENEEAERYKKFLENERQRTIKTESTKPPKVDPKYRNEHVLTGQSPFADKYPEFEQRKKSFEDVNKTIGKINESSFNSQNSYETDELRKKQEAERQKRQQEAPQKKQSKIIGQFDPYVILGLDKSVTCAEVKTRFKELIKRNNLAGIVNMDLQEKERKEAIVRDIIKAKDLIYKEKDCKK